MLKRAIIPIWWGKEPKRKAMEKMEEQCQGTILIHWSRLGAGKEVVLAS